MLSKRLAAGIALGVAFLAAAAPSAIAVECSDQVRYLSDDDLDGAYRYLENEQDRIYRGFPEFNDRFTRAELTSPNSIRTLTDLAERLAAQGCDEQGQNCVGDLALYQQLIENIRCRPLPTRFESPLFFELMHLASSEVVGAREAMGFKNQTARFGSLPTGTVGAEASMPPGVSRPIIIFNRDLFFFTGAFSKAVSDAIPISMQGGYYALDYSPEGIAARLRENPKIVENFAQAMARMVTRGTPRGATEESLDADHNRLHARLVTAMDIFSVAHEEAHLALGHVGPVEARQVVEGARGADTAILLQERTRAQEFAADALGFEFLVRVLEAGDDPVGLMVGCAAPGVLFKIMDAADAYRGAPTAFGAGNHPTARERIIALRTVYQRLRAQGGMLAQLPDLSQMFEASADGLLIAADTRIRALMIED